MAVKKLKGPRYVTEPYPPAPLPNVSDAVSRDLETLAVQYDSFEAFQAAMDAHAKTAWDNEGSDPVALEGLSDTTSGQFHDIRRQHERLDDYTREIHRIADRVWHGAKNRGHAPTGHTAGATHEPAKDYPYAG